jgi:uncharacterized protein
VVAAREGAFNFMECPQCNCKMSDKDLKCSQCGFDVLEMDQALSSCPVPKGFVNDYAGLLKPDEETQLEDILSKHKEHSGHDLVIVIQPHTKPLKPEQYVFWLYNEWGVGGKTHQGLMIFIAAEERRIETEVGFGLESIITDKKSAEILDRVMVPLLKENRYAEALRLGVQEVIEHLKASS